MASVEDLLRSSTLYRQLSAEDQAHLARVSLARTYEKGDTVFSHDRGQAGQPERKAMPMPMP